MISPELSSPTAAIRPEGLRALHILLGHYLLLTSIDLVNVGFPVHADRLGIGDGTIGVLAAAFTASAVLTRFVAWHAASRRGTAAVVAGAVALSMTMPLLYLLPTHPWAFLPVRIVHAFAPAAFMTGTLLLLIAANPPSLRNTVVGLHGAVGSISYGTGPVLALWLIAPTRGASWLYVTSALCGLLAALVLFRRGKGASEASDQRVDKAATAQAPSTERVNMGLLRRLDIRRSAILSVLVGMAVGGTVSFSALHVLRAGAGRPEAVFVTFAIWGALARYASGRLFERIHPRVFVMPSLAVLGAGLALLAVSGHPVTVLLAGTLVGAGYGASHTALLAYMIDRTHEGERWGVTTWFTTAYELGVTLGPIVIGLVAALYSVTGGFVTLALLNGIGAASAAAWLHREEALP